MITYHREASENLILVRTSDLFDDPLDSMHVGEIDGESVLILCFASQLSSGKAAALKCLIRQVIEAVCLYSDRSRVRCHSLTFPRQVIYKAQ